ncbi:mitochondrial ribosomal protein S25 isoform X2 [Bombus vancouverensis nearcticus]|uniref:mitochondrial ribosomal protein S25 isoform X2 n=1 Tax=Bombus vancouverensis nearcticus TaxID=2705178 RepID=UPI00402BBE08
MPFMIGRAPVRRTLNYLNSGKLILKDEIQIFSVNYNTHGEHHDGARRFVFWHLSQLQYKNPNVQIITFRNMTPTPFIKCYYENGNTMLIDIDGKSKEDILHHLQNKLYMCNTWSNTMSCYSTSAISHAWKTYKKAKYRGNIILL